MSNTVTISWKVYGFLGHRQKLSFSKSFKWDFTEGENTRVIEVLNSDVTGTNEYSIITITRNTESECRSELVGQLSDGAFENAFFGRVERIYSPV